mmetsp:Transcript_25407/g.101244  ORF Transcript_25407/g.101244 Transcript_25407/m.101244 type:complete len:719 (-) Transcript_25407:911-3067(-)
MALITSLSTEDLERFSSKAVAFACAGFASSPFTERSEELRLASVCLCCKLLARTMVLSTSITCVNMCVEPLTAALTMGLGDAFPDMKQACASAVTLLSRLAPQHLCGRFVATIRALSANISHQHAKTRLATLEALAFLFQTQHVNVDDREQLRSSLISSFQCTLCDRSYVCTELATRLRGLLWSNRQNLVYLLTRGEAMLVEHSNLFALLLCMAVDNRCDVSHAALSTLSVLGTHLSTLTQRWSGSVTRKLHGQSPGRVDDVDVPCMSAAGCTTHLNAIQCYVLNVETVDSVNRTDDYSEMRIQTARSFAALFALLSPEAESRSVARLIQNALTLVYMEPSSSTTPVSDELGCVTRALVAKYNDPDLIVSSVSSVLNKDPAEQNAVASVKQALALNCILVALDSFIWIHPRLTILAAAALARLRKRTLNECEVTANRKPLTGNCVTTAVCLSASCLSEDAQQQLGIAWLLKTAVADSDTTTTEHCPDTGIGRLSWASGHNSCDAFIATHGLHIMDSSLRALRSPFVQQPSCYGLLNAVVPFAPMAVVLHFDLYSHVLISEANPMSAATAEILTGAITLVHDIILHPEARKNLSEAALTALLDGVIIPNLAWIAGKTALTTRLATLILLRCLLRTTAAKAHLSLLLKTAAQLLQSLCTLLEDSDVSCRDMALCCLSLMFEYQPRTLPANVITQVHPSILKCLDDSNESIRLKACSTFAL